MLLSRPALSPGARASSFAAGRSQSQVLVLDDAFDNAGELEAFGRGDAVFAQPATAYPGLNAPLPADALAPLIETLRPLLENTFGVPANAPLGCNGYFGLVTLKPEDLTPSQSIPHVDHVGARGLAAVAYLCGEDQGGTGFYRHRSTGFERLTTDNILTYTSVLDAEMRAGPPSGYAVGDHPLFERIGAVAARYNRLVVYNCNLLHSGQVDPARLSADPAKGRLTLNLFIG